MTDVGADLWHDLDPGNYRVNYGNGQVSRSFKTEREAWAEHARASRDNGYARVQRYEAGSADDPGDWFTIKKPKRQRQREW